jgi:hypothetical protein
MAASVSGSKTVNNSVSPQLTGSALTTLMAIAIENLTVAQFKEIADALSRVPGGEEPTKTIGALLV